MIVLYILVGVTVVGLLGMMSRSESPFFPTGGLDPIVDIFPSQPQVDQTAALLDAMTEAVWTSLEASPLPSPAPRPVSVLSTPIPPPRRRRFR